MGVMTDTCGARPMQTLIKIRDMVFVRESLARLVVEMVMAHHVYFHLYFLVILTTVALLRGERTTCFGAPQQQITTKTKSMVFAKVRDSRTEATKVYEAVPESLEGYEYSLFHVAAHEAGHAIGLDHSNMESALMYPSYHLENDWMPDYNRGLDELYKLPYDDTSAAQYLYGPARSRPTQPTTRPTTTESPTQNCQWSNWSSYSTCSVTCGNGSKSRTRICENKSTRRFGPRTASHYYVDIKISDEPWKRRMSCDRQCSGSDEEKHFCNIDDCNSPTEPPIETMTTRTVAVTDGTYTSTTPYENPGTGGDDCITQTTFHTPLCSQPYDAIFQYSRGLFEYSISRLL